MSTPFEKLVGAGNDFIFFLKSNLPEGADLSQLAEKLCNRQFGIGADGLVVISQKPDQNLFRWDFFNSDGSHAEMCGNAARCTTLYIQRHFSVNHCQFETLAGVVSGEVISGSETSVTWEIASTNTKEVAVDIENFKSFNGQFINTGVPHYVVSNRLDKVTKEDCLMIQSHPVFGPEQTNVTLLETDNDGINHTKTFERGVKDFTLACGTGVIASAVVLKNQKVQPVYELSAPGGDLKVKIQNNNVTLIGPAQFVFEGQINLNEVPNV